MAESDLAPIPSNNLTAFSIAHNFSSDKIKTKEFLEAALGAVSIVKRFGKIFAPVTNDMSNNIEKLTQRYEEDTEAHTYLEDMILREQSSGEDVASDALLWLRRGLHFLSTFYRLLIQDSVSDNPTNDLAPFLKEAYENTLRQYHGWLGAQLFSVLSRFVPPKRNLLFTLALNQPDKEAIVINDMEKYNQGLNTCIKRLMDFYNANDLESASVI